MYAGQYPTTSYYQYPYTTTAAGGYYSHAPPVGAAGAVTATTVAGVGPGVEGSTMGGVGNQGAWSEEETERLKKLAEESKTAGGQPGDIDWDWVVNRWGTGRSRFVFSFCFLCVKRRVDGFC